MLRVDLGLLYFFTEINSSGGRVDGIGQYRKVEESGAIQREQHPMASPKDFMSQSLFNKSIDV